MKKTKETKACSKCGVKIPHERTAAYCNPCMAAYMKARYHEENSSVRATQLEYYQANKDVYLERSRAWSKAHYKDYYRRNKVQILAKRKARLAAKRAEEQKGL